jgi:hypothetical protein
MRQKRCRHCGGMLHAAMHDEAILVHSPSQNVMCNSGQSWAEDPEEIDRDGLAVHRDREGNRFVVTEGGLATYITWCCDASATFSMGVLCCRRCYEEVDTYLGGDVVGVDLAALGAR